MLEKQTWELVLSRGSLMHTTCHRTQICLLAHWLSETSGMLPPLHTGQSLVGSPLPTRPSLVWWALGFLMPVYQQPQDPTPLMETDTRGLESLLGGGGRVVPVPLPP